MIHPRKGFERFCYRNRDKGIPDLMLYLCLGSALVYFYTLITQNPLMYGLLSFDRARILRGEVWRLFTYPLTYHSDNIFYSLIGYLCYYSLGRAMENIWGTCKFNLFYLSGVVMMDIYCMIFGGQADVYYLNLSLFLSYATMYPHAHFLLLFIIPVRAWIFALLDLAEVLRGLIVFPFPYNLFAIVSLANYFLFFGKDVRNLFPLSWRANFSRLFRRFGKKKAKQAPIPNAGSYEASHAAPKAPYTHKCAVCGRTDVSNPELEFRYCSRCSGFYCYCQDHISSHTHIQ